jgi:hypothetical protein
VTEEDRSAPLPGSGAATVVVEPPGAGPGYWAGAPSAASSNGDVYLAYRLRRPVGQGRGFAAVVAGSDDGQRFDTLVVLDRDDMGAESLERPALTRVPGGGWRLYVSCATPGTLHWRVDVLEASDPSGFDPERRTTVLPGDKSTAMKDPVVLWSGGQWHLWVCCHPLDVAEEADRMHTRYATSADGLDWTWRGVALAGRPGSWDERGARITSVLLDRPAPVAYYDGRASSAQNWEEQTGLAFGSGPGLFQAEGTEPAAQSPHEGHGLRYLSVLPLTGGGHRLYYEATRPDGSHDLRTEYVPPSR